MIERILNKYSIPPYLLAIELTESALMTDPKGGSPRSGQVPRYGAGNFH
jgi:hypothetical protein